MLEEARFREVMSQFATGVTVVTARSEDGEAVGLTVSALTSVSLNPTLLLVCIQKDAASHDQILSSGTFAVNILTAQQEGVALQFAQAPPEERFAGLDFDKAPLGNPLLHGALAWLECEVRETWTGGDHSVILAEALSCEGGGGSPLLFFRSGLRGLGE